MTSMNNPRADRLWSGARILSFLVILAASIILAKSLDLSSLVAKLQTWVSGLGGAGYLIFGVIYVAAALAFIPGAALTLAAAPIFGFWKGILVVSLASTTAAALAFLIARHLARDRIAALARRYPRFRAIDAAIGEGGWKVVAMLRLSPAVPFSAGNYLFGLTPVRFWPATLASWIFMLPGTFLYVYLGHLGASTVTNDAGAEAGASRWKTILLVLGLGATVGVIRYVGKLAKAALEKQGAIVDDAPAAAPSGSGRAATILLMAAALVFSVGAAWATTHREKLKYLFGPPSVVLEETYASSPDAATFDHGVLDALLHKYVKPGGWVDYKGLGRESKRLHAYLASLAQAPFEKLGRDEKLAFLINAYNASTLKLILEHPGIKSIRDIPDADRWNAKRWHLLGKTLSLNQIEHEEIRPHFAEPRVHFALVCAAVGCPPLRAEAYVGKQLEKQLQDQSRYVHTHPRWYRLKGRVLSLTKLYDWYESDFKQAAGSVLAFVARQSPAVKDLLAKKAKLAIKWLPYDWKLNSVENRP
ncbi:MAG TPA: DUF547 domain-containing protein [Planctomycetes bacterium]|nr:DUF547 domain-containing protein [Planctomycetota bacterium]